MEVRDIRRRLKHAGYDVGEAEAARLVESLPPSSPIHHLIRGLGELRGSKATVAFEGAGSHPGRGSYSKDFQMHEPFDSRGGYLAYIG